MVATFLALLDTESQLNADNADNLVQPTKKLALLEAAEAVALCECISRLISVEVTSDSPNAMNRQQDGG